MIRVLGTTDFHHWIWNEQKHFTASLRIVTALILVLAGAGCSSHLAWSRNELCFGLSTDSGLTILTEQQWQQFVTQEIIPRFPDGFTVFKTEGYWQENGETAVEPSRILMVVAPDTEETRSKLDAIADAYVKQFHQNSVLLIKTPAEIEFHN